MRQLIMTPVTTCNFLSPTTRSTSFGLRKSCGHVPQVYRLAILLPPRNFMALAAIFAVGVIQYYAVEAAPSAKIPLNILQIGDSFSAGNGARGKYGNKNYYGPKNCQRSPTNWGGQYVQLLENTGAFDITYTNRACSGAHVPNVLSEDQESFTFEARCPLYPSPYPEEYFIQATPTHCSFFVRPPIEAVNETVDLVLFTIGANDASFDGVLEYCLLPPLSNPDKCQKTINRAVQAMPEISQNVSDLYLDIYRRISPRNATKFDNPYNKTKKIMVLSYPHLVQDVDFYLDTPLIKPANDTTNLTQAINVTPLIRHLVNLGVAAIREAVHDANRRAGVDFIYLYNGTRELFAGHEPDPRPGRINPVGWSWDFTRPWNFIDFYHPKPAGHKHIAEAVFAEGGGTFGVVPGY